MDTVKVAPHFTLSSGGVEPTDLAVCYNKLYYVSRSNSHGSELYEYDGTTAPKRVSDINAGKGSSLPSSFTMGFSRQRIIGYKGFIFFIADTIAGASKGMKLYKYDPNGDIGSGNPALVYDVKAFNVEFIKFDDNLYFAGSDSTYGTELWMYDGVNNPSIIADINTGTGDGNPVDYAVYRNNLYFTAVGKGTGRELYRLGKSVHVENVGRVNRIRVYPVPATNIVHFEIDLKTSTDITVTLNNITGREVYSSGMRSYKTGNAIVKVNISQLAEGYYVYCITSRDGTTLASGKMLKL